jgi:hypothetical protein
MRESSKNSGQNNESAGRQPRPFDTEILSTFPQADDRDPPYHSWWVVSSEPDADSSNN